MAGKKSDKKVRLGFRPDGTVWNLDTKRKVVPKGPLHWSFLKQEGENAFTKHPEYFYHPSWPGNKEKYEHAYKMKALKTEIHQDPRRIERRERHEELQKRAKHVSSMVKELKTHQTSPNIIQSINSQKYTTISVMGYRENPKAKAEKGAKEFGGVKYGAKQHTAELITIPTYLAKNLKFDDPIWVNTKNYELLLEAIDRSKQTHAKEAVLNMAGFGRVRNADSLGYGDLFIVKKNGYVGSPNKVLRLDSVLMGDDLYKLIHHQNMKVKLEFYDDDFDFMPLTPYNEYVETLDTQNDCTIKFILANMKESYERYFVRQGSKKILTHDVVANILFEGREFKPKKNTLEHMIVLPETDIKLETMDFKGTIHDVIKFCKKYKVDLTAYDIFGEIVAEQRHEKPTSNMRSHIYCVIHNNHCYPLLDDLKSLAQKTSSKAMPKSERDELRRDKFPKINIKEGSAQIADNYKDLVKIMSSLEGSGSVDIYYNDDLNTLFNKFVEKDYEPSIKFAHNKITQVSLSFMAGAKEPLTVKIQNFGEAMPDKESFVIYFEELRKLMNNTFIPFYKSHYSSSLADAFVKYPKAQLTRRLRDDAPESSMGLDCIRAYTANLLEMEKIPVFKQHDEFREYDGHKLEDYTIYLVENDVNTIESWFVADKRISLISGMVLRRSYVPLKIIAFCRPCSLEINNIRSDIKRLYHSDVPDSIKKFRIAWLA